MNLLRVVPYWAVWPFETLVLARQPLRELPEFSAAQRRALADILSQLTIRYDNLFETSFPYTMGLHQGPGTGAALPCALLSAAAAIGHSEEVHGRLRDAGHAAARHPARRCRGAFARGASNTLPGEPRVISAMTSTAGFQTRSEGSLRVLENEHLRVVIAPQRGGKLISLFSRRTNTEWLLPPLRPYAEARSDAGFEEWDGGGFDECLPTVAPSGTSPDHGELWRKPWQEEDPVTLRSTACGGALTVRAASAARRGIAFAALPGKECWATRAESPLLRPSAASRGAGRSDSAYRMKCAAFESKDPASIGLASAAIRLRGRRRKGEDLSIVGPPDGTQADKLFTGILSEGWCAVFRPSLQEGIKLLFDAQTLPYLGLWICRAAWPESGEAKQYTVALEPASAPADALADAEHEGTAWRLEAGQERTLGTSLCIDSSVAKR